MSRSTHEHVTADERAERRARRAPRRPIRRTATRTAVVAREVAESFTPEAPSAFYRYGQVAR